MGEEHGRIPTKGIYEYGISPFRQRAFGPDYWHVWRAFGRGLVRTCRLIAVPFCVYSGFFWWGKSYFERLHRKDPYEIYDEEA